MGQVPSSQRVAIKPDDSKNDAGEGEGSHLPVSTYEAMFLLDSSKVAVSWDEAVKSVHDILAKHNAEIVAHREWDERRLAYPVENHKKGTYLLTYFKTEGANLKDITADCHLSE